MQVGLARTTSTTCRRARRRSRGCLGIDVPSYIRQVRGAGPVQFVVAETLRPRGLREGGEEAEGDPRKPARTTRRCRSVRRSRSGAPCSARWLRPRPSRSGARTVSPQVGDDVGQWGLEAGVQPPPRRHAGRQHHRAQPGHGRRAAHARGPTGQARRAASYDALDASPGGRRDGPRIVDRAPRRSSRCSRRRATSSRSPTARSPSTFDRALAGAYAPGSTFKVITDDGAAPSTGSTRARPSPCPTTITVDGRVFRNFEGESGALVELRRGLRDLVQHGVRLARPEARRHGPPDHRAASSGVGRNAHLPFGTASSHVPAGGDAVSRAAMMIGQDRIVATPLAMAGVAATIANGRWRQPRLLTTDLRVAGTPAPPAQDLATVRTLMRRVVTQRHRHSARLDARRDPACKTGTAEFGGGNPPPTDAWFICLPRQPRDLGAGRAADGPVAAWRRRSPRASSPPTTPRSSSAERERGGDRHEHPARPTRRCARHLPSTRRHARQLPRHRHGCSSRSRRATSRPAGHRSRRRRSCRDLSPYFAHHGNGSPRRRTACSVSDAAGRRGRGSPCTSPNPTVRRWRRSRARERSAPVSALPASADDTVRAMSAVSGLDDDDGERRGTSSVHHPECSSSKY